ncbi:MAG: DUF418 domain-containing protein [Gemmatimonadota bacterium]|nr:MAG: DUF418 domain-containing protein [Gemmatimonadota bacterium]
MNSDLEQAVAERLPRAAQPAPWGPVPGRARIITLDALRGVAIFGMLLVNIFYFALPPESRNLLGEGAAAGERAVALVVALFAEGKFYTLFSILFGMGLALQSQRARESGTRFARLYLRRLTVLLLIGVVHGLLFSAADILALYAIAGLIALALRELPPKRLLVLAVTLYAAGVLLLGVYAAQSPDGSLPAEPNWQQLVADPQSQPAEASVQILRLTFVPLLTGRSQDGERGLYEFMADEERIFKSGSWTEMLRHRAVSYLLAGIPIRVLFTSWRVLPLFLLGIYFVRRGIFVEADRKLAPYKTMLFSGLVVGLLLELVGGAAQLAGSGHVLTLAVFLIGIFAGVPMLSLAYAGAVAILCARRGGSVIVRAFAAVGRMALTNYVGQSVLAGVLFYSWGLGLYGELDAVQCVVVALLIFAIQLALSTVWLRFFQFGPLEWVWRTLSYGRAQPVLSRSLG